ncbi:RCC1/BLIP-II [Xylaria scruposa]|nr:RCC1/BLIP-II [Xylaria scruposa]
MAPRTRKPAAAAEAPTKAPKRNAAPKSETTTTTKASTRASTTKTTTKPAPKAAPKSTAKATKAAAETKKPATTAKAAAATKTKAATTKKTAPAKKAASEKKAAVEKKKPAKNINGKRPIDEDETEDVAVKNSEASDTRPQKRARVAATEDGPTGWRKQIVAKRRKRDVVDNPVPTTPLDIFVFGEGSAGELGLGSKVYPGEKKPQKPTDVKRPRINHNLGAEAVGVVDIACGGMHAVALTKDNRVLTWGVNDDKALGRDTTWAGGVVDADADSDDEDDEDKLNPLESTPTQIDNGELEETDIICKVIASDSASFVLTTDGFVFGWGTFRGADGIIGFAKDIRVQPTPMLIAPLQDITNIACGSNHVIAIDIHGKVWTWGSGGQFQLGRKPITRHGGPTATLHPQPCGMFGKRHYATDIAAGSYHSFYTDNQGRVWSWGLNNYSQTGHYDDTGKDDAMVLQPKLVASLKDENIEQIAGGEHHSVARTKDGRLLTWGRVDGHQVGQPFDLFTEDNAMFDENKKPRILLKPTAIANLDIKFVAAGVDTSFAIDSAGRVYSWGFSATYQTGQGTTDDIEIPTLIDNSAVHGRKIVLASAGGQFSVLAAAHGEAGSPAVNGN